MVTVRDHSRHEQAFTLIEVLLVVTVVALLLGGATYTVRNVTRSQLRSAASRTAAAMRFAFDRALVTGSTIRLAIDMDRGVMWLERSSQGFALRAGRDQHATTDAKEAEDATQTSKRSPLTSLLGGMMGTDEEGEDGQEGIAGIDAAALVKAYEADLEPIKRPKALFEPLKGLDTKKLELNRRVRFAAVLTPHLDVPAEDGKEYVYFFPQGQAEPAIIHLANNSEDYYSVVLHPLTGGTEVFSCRYRMPEEFGSETDLLLSDRDPCERKP